MQTLDRYTEPKQTEFQFYPTPPNVVRQLVSPYYSMTARVLEPSAGRGDILDALPNPQMASTRMEINCCEISPDLRAILLSKGYKVIGTDFLTMLAPYLFGLVVMNPPFANCAEHVIKAWGMLAPEGKLGAILPRSAIGKTIGKFAELNQLIDLFGTVEEIGKAFAGAERKTNVDCVIVRLEKPAAKTFNPFENFNPQMDEEYVDAEERTLPAPRDMVRAIVAQYQAAMRALKLAHESELAFRALIPDQLSEREAGMPYHQRVDKVKEDFWKLIFEKTHIGEVTTSGYRQQFMDERAKLSQMEFSEETIYEVLERFIQNKDAILEQCVMDVFKQVTRYSMDNVVVSESWVTNKSHKITVKIIVPYAIELDWRWNLRWRFDDFLNDLDKCLMMFGGTGGTSTAKALREILDRINNHELTYSDKFETPNFYFRIYKKGTLHLWFRDEKALEMINRYAAERRMFVLGSGR